MLVLALSCAIALVAIWVGYPLVMAALAALRGRAEVVPLVSRPRVSVIIATVDGPAVVEARVRDALRGDYPAELLEVVVGVDGQGPMRGVSLAGLGMGDRVRVVDGGPPGGKAVALNAAVAASRGEILVFTDAAQRFAPHTIGRLCDALADTRFGAVSGALHIGDGAPASLAERYWLFEKWLRHAESRVHSTVGVTGAVYAMRRDCWEPLPAGLILDDVFGPMRVVLRGHRVGFCPEAEAFDDRRFAPAQEFRRKARTLTGVLQLCAWLPDVLVPIRNPIWAQFVFHKLLRLLTPYLLAVMLIALVSWAVGTVGARAPLLALAVTAGTMLAGLAVISVSRRVREGVMMAAAMQAAVIRATINGLRGRWDVWSR